MKLLLLFFLLTCSSLSIADEKFTEAQNESIQKQLQTTLSYETIPSYSKGILSDGNEYINLEFDAKEDLDATEKLQAETGDSTQYISRCAIFQMANGGELMLASKSAPIVNAGFHSNVFCAVKNKSVLMTVDVWAGGDHSSTVYKFSQRNKALMLTGVDDFYVYHHSKTDHWIETVSSYNFLSNQVMHSIKKGEYYKEYEGDGEFPILPFRVTKPYQYKELKFNIKPYPKQTFSDFDNEKFYDWMTKQKNACGNFDENLKFKACKPY